jgi:hypothetical protein
MLLKKRYGNIRSSGFGFTSGGENTIHIFIRKTLLGEDVAEKMIDGFCLRRTKNRIFRYLASLATFIKNILNPTIFFTARPLSCDGNKKMFT